MPFLRCFSSFFFFILGELCPGLELVSSPVAKCAYKQHRYRNKCIATGSIYTWAFSIGDVSTLSKELCLYVSSRGYLNSRMLVACGIGLQKLVCIIGAWSIHLRGILSVQ